MDMQMQMKMQMGDGLPSIGSVVDHDLAAVFF
jgi:hypothetical protein